MRGVRPLTSVVGLVVGMLVGLTTPAADATSAGDDGRVVFVRANQIYTMTATGHHVRRLTSMGKSYRPEWSPDGRRIAYIHEAAGRHAVWVMKANGRGKHPVSGDDEVTSAGATWSPDGQTLAYTGMPSPRSDGELRFVSSTDRNAAPRSVGGYRTGGLCDEGPEVVYPTFTVDRYLAWSPEVDGTSQIAVGQPYDCYFDWAVAMYHPETGELRQLPDMGASDRTGYFLWSDFFFGPGGEFGYTEKDRGDFDGIPGPRVIVYPGFASRDGDTSGAPSPSGRSMIFTNNASGTAYVMRANVDGTRRHRLAVGYQPDWGVRPQA